MRPVEKSALMKPKVIFLDVDGVLNRLTDDAFNALDNDMIARLARIVAVTDARIVLSSFWRYSQHAVEELNARLLDYGLVIHSHTPKSGDWKFSGGIVGSKTRGAEIQQWMDENWTPERFVILDDNTDMAHLMPYLVRTSSYSGLTDRDAGIAIKRLEA